MNKNIQGQNKFYLKNRNIKSNKNIKAYLNNPLNNQKSKKSIKAKLQIKKKKLLSPIILSINQKLSAYTKSFKNKDLDINNIQKGWRKIDNNDVYEDMTNYNTLSKINEDKILFEKPKVRIRILSTEHNRNTISSEKNNNPIKYKIHKLKPKNLKYIENETVSPTKSNSTFKQNKINYGEFNSIQNNLDSSETNVIRKNKEFSSLNFYYNMMQEKSLNNLNSKIENLIKKQCSSANTTTRNHIIIKQNNNKNMKDKSKNQNIDFNTINHYKKKVYKKKIQRKSNNNWETFSDLTFFEKNSEQKNNKYLIYDNKNKLSQLSFNTLKNNKTYEVISYDCQTPNKSELYSQCINQYENINNNCKNSTILLPGYKCQEPKNFNNNEFIKIENYNNISSLKLNDNNKSDTINILDIINQDYNIEKKNKVKKYFPKINYNNALRYKKSFDFTSPKSNTEIYNNKNLNFGKNSIKNPIKNNININDNLNKMIHKNFNNLKNNYILVNSNSINDYNTISALNTTEKLHNLFNNETNKKEHNLTICEDYFKPNYFNLNKKNLVKNKNELLILPNSNKFKQKKLKNVITSIQYKNKNKSNLNDANIILSEFDKNGKLNIKVKKMNKSIEKAIRENSNPKLKNICYLKSPKIKNERLTYIKSNQGALISKNKKHNTMNKIG